MTTTLSRTITEARTQLADWYPVLSFEAFLIACAYFITPSTSPIACIPVALIAIVLLQLAEIIWRSYEHAKPWRMIPQRHYRELDLALAKGQAHLEEQINSLNSIVAKLPHPLPVETAKNIAEIRESIEKRRIKIISDRLSFHNSDSLEEAMSDCMYRRDYNGMMNAWSACIDAAISTK